MNPTRSVEPEAMLLRFPVNLSATSREHSSDDGSSMLSHPVVTRNGRYLHEKWVTNKRAHTHTASADTFNKRRDRFK